MHCSIIMKTSWLDAFDGLDYLSEAAEKAQSKIAKMDSKEETQDNASDFPAILDSCCGSRSFWFDKNDKRALFVDKRRGIYPIVHSDRPRNPVVVQPDCNASFTNLPFPSDSFYHVVFDPPHLVNSSASGNIAKYYGVLGENWRDELRNGLAECFRVLRKGGTLIFKWNEANIPIKEILALTTKKPLYGHKSGKASNTHWVVFLK